MNRRGVTLLELLAMLPLLAAASLLSARLGMAVVQDIPRASRAMGTHDVLLNMIDSLQQDVDAAASLPESIGGRKTGEKLLVLQFPDGMVSYEGGPDEVIRRKYQAGSGDAQDVGAMTSEVIDSWSLPNAKVSFQRRMLTDSAYAVEVHTSVQIFMEGAAQERFVSSRLLCLNAMPAALEEQLP